ncbi:HNH endonuclease signature motif containing protein [Geodermatophilus sp. Leaf369]|uniref:HNH endonuclease signature motif containing protein n=1 Tax=Geodermatophilus sp. Leaf369 TaxID=1736354 RepID=UPI000ADC2C4F|nr:HNH endonuclease signature motif containing protein [Geodermatophilus sp. Leaf369]
MARVVARTRFGVSLSIARVEVFASAAAQAAVEEAERIAQVSAGLLPPDATSRPTRLAELLVTEDTDRAGVHAVLRDVADAQAQLHALQAAAISRLAELQPAQQSLPGARADDPADPDRPDDWVADEVAVVLGIGIGSASVLVDRQRVLVEQLPRVWGALADGEIDVRRCQVLVDALAHRKQSAGGGLPDDVVDAVAAQGLAWIGEGVGPTPLADRVGGALIAADPAEADRRAERRRRKQNVTTVGAGDGLAGLRADLLDAADAAAMQGVVDALAAVMRRGGDHRPIGQLRVEALKQLLTRPWETLPEEVARTCWDLRLRVDLADLDDRGPGPGTGVGAMGRLPVGPAAVAELLAGFDALVPTGPAGGGSVWFEVVDGSGRLRAISSPAEARAAVRRGRGLGPPPAVDGYEPSAAQVRFVQARDRHCRFPGCARPAQYTDLDHVVPRDHDDPAAGGPTCVTNLASGK